MDVCRLLRICPLTCLTKALPVFRLGSPKKIISDRAYPSTGGGGLFQPFVY